MVTKPAAGKPTSEDSTTRAETAVALHISESRVWAGDGRAEWEGALAVRRGRDGELQPVPAGPAGAQPWQTALPVEHDVVRFIESGHLALGPTAVPTGQALAVAMAGIVGRLGLTEPVAQATVVFPTHWGLPRRTVLDTAVRRIARETRLVPTAVSAGAVRIGRRGYVSGRARCVVLEFAPLTTTASYVTYDAHGGRIESCEHLPTLSMTELATSSAAAEEFDELLDTVAADRQIDAVLLVGVTDPAALELVSAAVRARYSGSVDIRPVTGRDLVRAPGRSVEMFAAPSRGAARKRAEWLQPIPHDRATGGGARRVVIGAVVATVAVAGAAALWFLRPTQQADPWSPKAGANSSVPSAPTRAVKGRVAFEIPPGWRTRDAAPGEPAERVILIPADGARRRIMLEQDGLSGDRNPSPDRIVAGLRDKVGLPHERTRYGPNVGQEQLGGRPVYLYEEFPDANSQVKWHVMVEHGAQLSVGCQFLTGEWDAIAGACERTVTSAVIGP